MAPAASGSPSQEVLTPSLIVSLFLRWLCGAPFVEAVAVGRLAHPPKVPSSRRVRSLADPLARRSQLDLALPRRMIKRWAWVFASPAARIPVRHPETRLLGGEMYAVGSLPTLVLASGTTLLAGRVS